jgi:hypothetical protein
MKALENVWDLVKQFTANPKYVEISEVSIESWIDKMKEVELKNEALPPKVSNDIELLEYELIAGAINYCYWYGSSKIRPCGANAWGMYDVLNEVYDPSGVDVIQNFISSLSLNRFPLMNERSSHLMELINIDYKMIAVQLYDSRGDLEDCLESVLVYPGYANDMFLKRASLFFMQVARKSDMFKSQVDMLPVPADYQIPKMLEHMGILQYSDELKNVIDEGILIPSGSLMECEIRASMIAACKTLCEKSGKNPSVVDYWLWLNRKSCDNNFHLTITTDY